MTLTLELTPEEEARLRAAANAQGLPVETCLRSLIATLPDTPEALARAQYEATRALIDEWNAEDANMTPEEIAAEQAEWEEFKHNINAYRAENGEEPVF